MTDPNLVQWWRLVIGSVVVCALCVGALWILERRRRYQTDDTDQAGA